MSLFQPGDRQLQQRRARLRRQPHRDLRLVRRGAVHLETHVQTIGPVELATGERARGSSVRDRPRVGDRPRAQQDRRADRERRSRQIGHAERAPVVVEDVAVGVADGGLQLHGPRGRRERQQPVMELRVERSAAARALHRHHHGSRRIGPAGWRARRPRDGDGRPAVRAASGADPDVHHPLRTRRRQRRGGADDVGRNGLRRGRLHARVLDVGRVRRPVAFARAHVDPRLLHLHRDLVELAVLRVARRRVAEQVEGAGFAHHLAQRLLWRVGVDEGFRAGALRDRAQDVGDAAAQPGRVERVDRGVVVVRGLGQLAQLLRLIRPEPGQPFAHEDDRLAPFFDAAEMDRRRFQRRHRHFRSHACDVAQLEHVVLGGAARRHVDAEPSFEFGDLLAQLAAIACQPERVDREQRVHQRDEVGRAERLRDERGQRAAPLDRFREPADVVLVPENHEHADLVPRRFGGGVLGRSDRQRGLVARGRAAVSRHQLERADRLRRAVFLDREIVGVERRQRLAVAIDDGDVDADQVRFRAERRRLGRLGRLGRDAGGGRDKRQQVSDFRLQISDYSKGDIATDVHARRSAAAVRHGDVQPEERGGEPHAGAVAFL